MSEFKVILTGFKTEQQAIDFAIQWSESGEQHLEFSDGGTVETDMTKLHESGGFKVNEAGELVIPLIIFNHDRTAV